jgi:hypothetical protein
MKKLLTLIFFISLTVAGFSQIFKPVAPFGTQRNMVGITSTEVLSHKWQWRIDGTVQVSELVYNKVSKLLETNAVFGAGPSLSYQHYVPGETGEAFNNYGFGAGVLLGDRMKFILQANIMQYIKIGITVTPKPQTNIFPVGAFFGGGITF